MKYTSEKLKQIQSSLNGASTHEEMFAIAKELGYDLTKEEAAAFFAKVQTTEEPEGKIADEQITDVNGGFGTDSIPQYQEIKEYCKEKGSNLAFTLCIYYIPSPICYQIIEHIEGEIEMEKKLMIVNP